MAMLANARRRCLFLAVFWSRVASRRFLKKAPSRLRRAASSRLAALAVVFALAVPTLIGCMGDSGEGTATGGA
jgi:hypothetical protein